MIITSENVFNNPKLNETSNIAKNTECELLKKYGCDCDRKIEVMYDVEYIDKFTNKLKSVKINHYYIRYRISSTICASNIRYAVIKVNKLIFVIEVKLKEDVIKTYLELNNPVLMGVRRFFFFIRNNRDFINNFCNSHCNKLRSIL